ncbi:hypothetical protein BK133_06555 [Paenibacillus sp. FSL H8-0548]|uniref:hypothetical protein n=1 Tax=Paenibacillus sp. FSL H8-0548 TaxID=1920422 RepID=UPI00096E91BF|nr:hypothetical protein [Paenibacillus sp. FSL H8-0548]OMF37258.1 hypothetical protein BK133_06555 [Paenibacillus sp. FSL H8-0548]
MFRIIARAHIKEGMEEEAIDAAKREQAVHELIEQGEIMTAGCFKWERNVYVYFESVDRQLEPEEILPRMASYLEDWPGQAASHKWIPMIDVFHFNEPASYEHWLRKEPVERRVGRVAHLKPEMAASYIYYHYQLQEERAFLGPKYEIIAMHENMLFGYQEFPAVVEEPVLPGKLSTAGTPPNWGDSRMDLHFQPWEDGHLYFKPVEQLFAYYSDSFKKRRENMN